MNNFRRTYFYSVSFFSLQGLLWGLIGLLRTISELGMDCTFANLSGSLAMIVVSGPAFFLHWGWANRIEKNQQGYSPLPRAIFLYAALFSSLIPAVHNFLAFLNRVLIKEAVADTCQPFIGGNQSWPDNLIAISLTLMAAGVIKFFILDREDEIRDTRNYADVRRVFRYLWVVYGLSLTLVSIHEIIKILSFLPGSLMGEDARALIINPAALAVVGVPIWVSSWNTCQKPLRDGAENETPFRRVFLYLLVMGGAVLSIISAYQLMGLIGEGMGRGMASLEDFLRDIGSTLAAGLPALIVWRYHKGWFLRSIRGIQEDSQRKRWEQGHQYPLLALGLALTCLGIMQLMRFSGGLLISSRLINRSYLTSRLLKNVFRIVLGVVIWLPAWMRVQVEASGSGEDGHHARISPIRRGYLYGLVFLSIIVVLINAMVFIASLLNQFIFLTEFDTSSSPSLPSLLNPLSYLILFGILFAYHLIQLRRDSNQEETLLSQRKQPLAVLVLGDEEEEYLADFKEAMKQQAPDVPVTVHSPRQGMPEEAEGTVKAVVFPAFLLEKLPAEYLCWLQEYEGKKIILKGRSAQWILQGLTSKQAAQVVRQLSECEDIQISRMTIGKIIVMVFLGLLGLLIVSRLLNFLYFLI